MFMPKRHGFWWTQGEGLILHATYGITPMLLNLNVSLVGINGERSPKLT